VPGDIGDGPTRWSGCKESGHGRRGSVNILPSAMMEQRDGTRDYFDGQAALSAVAEPNGRL